MEPPATDLFDSITPSSRVTIRTPQGHERTGTVVMRGPAGWVLNLGGPHGTPGVATPENVVRVRKGNPGRCSADIPDGVRRSQA